MEAGLLVYALALLLAFGIEFGIEYYIVPIFNHVPVIKDLRWILIYISLGLAIGLSFYYKVDAVALLLQRAATPVGMIFTGTFIGAGVEAVHRLFQNYVRKHPE